MIDRPKEPPKFDDDADFGDAFPTERPTSPGGEGVPEERPTVSPPFDVEEYAKASDSKVRAAKSSSPAGGSDASTKPPPALPELNFDEEMPRLDRTRPPQITLTDEDELETARLRSVMIPSDPPPRRGPSSGPAVDVLDGEAGPATVAYPAEYEKDPFARLSGTGSAVDLGKPLQEMRDRFSLGDYTGALEIAETILGGDPVNAEATRSADECRTKLVQMYTARIGPLDRVPMVVVAREQLRWLSIDHRAGFLLSHIDGVSSLEMILDVSGMPLLDALKILCELSQQRVINFR